MMIYIYRRQVNLDSIRNKDENRDVVILSKGHGVLGFYPVLLSVGLIDNDLARTYKQFGSELISHPIKNIDNGIESSNGSLGHGLSYGAGVAQAKKIKELGGSVFILMGDGECAEGSIWEAANLCSDLEIKSITAVIDCNSYQSDTCVSQSNSAEVLRKKWSAFGWNVVVCDGHDFNSINEAFSMRHREKANVIISKTIKGKGIPFMENNNEWHHGRLTKSIYEQAKEELQ